MGTWHGASFADSLPVGNEPRWWWGVSSLEYLFQVALDLVRVAPDGSGNRRQRLRAALDVVRAFQRLDGLYWDAAFAAVDHDLDDQAAWAAWAAERYAARPAVTAPSSPRTAMAIAACLARIRGEVASLDLADQAAQRVLDPTGAVPGASPADEPTSRSLDPPPLTQEEAAERLYTVAASIAQVLRDVLADVEPGDVEPGDVLAVDDDAGAVDPGHEHLALVDALRHGDGSDLTMLRTLLGIWVIQATTQHDRLEREQPIDLLPITSNGAVTVDPRQRDRPDEKLASGQLANFGGSVKRSWRANDHLWGRLDAAERSAGGSGPMRRPVRPLPARVSRRSSPRSSRRSPPRSGHRSRTVRITPRPLPASSTRWSRSRPSR